MRARPLFLLTAALLLAAPLATGGHLVAQEDAVQAYYRGLADHFDLPAVEVRVLSEWQIRPDEVPVALFLARHGGVSPDALIALKRGGRSWAELAERYDLQAGAFHVPLPAGASAGSLAGVYERFRSTPSSGWDGISLSEAELTELVNLKVVSDYLDLPAARVLAARDAAGSWVAAYQQLLRAGS